MKRKRKRDPASLQYAACFTADEMRLYRTGGLPENRRAEIFHHLNVKRCARCREVYALTAPGDAVVESDRGGPGTVSGRDKMAAAARRYPPVCVRRTGRLPLNLEPGQIWTTTPTPRDIEGRTLPSVGVSPPVLIISAGNGVKTLGNIIRVLPVSFDIEFDFPGETILLGENSPLMYPILLEIFNERPMLAGNLDEYRGAVPPDALALIMEARGRFPPARGPRPDPEFLAWKEREIELTEHLSFPVNEALWEEEDRSVDISVRGYRKAADTSRIELSEVSSHLLLETASFRLAVVQVRDRFLLRFVPTVAPAKGPDRILINGKEVSMTCETPGIYEYFLGPAGRMSGEMEINAEIEGSSYVFHARFVREPR
ncbi:MAG: hypothetical protein JRJ35_16065 [Deltaproteobacteria bacterium]|nr:hypothetical protein [Deltaproteobacteria bacterium]